MVYFLICVACVIVYGVMAHRAIEILDKVNCNGTFVEWFACFCPIWHIIIYAKHKNVCKFTTFKSIITDLKEQYETMSNKLNKYQ